MILDGWGIGDGSKSDVISTAPTPNLDLLRDGYPHSRLFASGEDVGLPDGQMGNSEVGHLNIGAGRIIYQDLVKINLECKTGEIRKNRVLTEALLMHVTIISRSISWVYCLTEGFTQWISISITCVILQRITGSEMFLFMVSRRT